MFIAHLSCDASFMCGKIDTIVCFRSAHIGSLGVRPTSRQLHICTNFLSLVRDVKESGSLE